MNEDELAEEFGLLLIMAALFVLYTTPIWTALLILWALGGL